MPELKPCPFCGGKAKVLGGQYDWYTPSCMNRSCGCDWVDSYPTEAEAIEAWNTRVKPGDDKSLTDEEREILNDMPALKRLAMIAGFEVVSE